MPKPQAGNGCFGENFTTFGSDFYVLLSLWRMASSSKPSEVVVWEWEERPGLWIPYEVDVVRLLEDHLKHRVSRNSKVNLGQSNPRLYCYEVDLVNMEQLNVRSGRGSCIFLLILSFIDLQVAELFPKAMQVQSGSRTEKLIDNPFMHQSIPAVPIPPPPRQPRGICSHCQSRGWGIRNFIAARGLGISIPRGNLWAFDTRVFEIEISFFIGKDEAFVKDWLVHQGLEKLVDVFKALVKRRVIVDDS